MALHVPAQLHPTKPWSPSLLAPAATNAGLRAPSSRLALSSSVYYSPLDRLLGYNLRRRLASAAPKFSMRVASRQAYICRDCGYIYNDRNPFEKLPDNYFCPVCGAPKRRFKPYVSAVAKNANTTDVRKARKAEIQKDEAIGRALPIAIVVGLAVLAGLYFYLNNAFPG